MQKPPDRSLTEKRRKLKAARAVPETELMATASEGEGEMKETNRGNSCSLQSNIQIPSERSTVNVLKNLPDNEYLHIIF